MMTTLKTRYLKAQPHVMMVTVAAAVAAVMVALVDIGARMDEGVVGNLPGKTRRVSSAERRGEYMGQHLPKSRHFS